MIWQALAIAVGIGVMAAPDLLGLSEPVSNAFHILGPIAVAFGAMAASTVLRGLRRVHLLLGPAIALAPFVLGGELAAIIVGVVAGAVLVVLAFPGGADPGQYGGGWRKVLDPRSDTD